MLVQQVILYTVYFITYSFIGWLLESFYASFSAGAFVNRGFLAGPFCPLYGIGALLLLLLYHLLPNLTALLFLAMLICSALEYAAGLLMEKTLELRWWRYKNPLAFLRGRLSLPTSFSWGLLAVFLLDVLHPLLAPSLASMSTFGALLLIGLFSAYLVTDLAFTTNAVHNLNRRLASMTKLQERVCNRKQHIHYMLEDQLDTLEDRYHSILENRSSAQVRLVRAFPTLESAQYGEALRVLKNAVNKGPSDRKDNICSS